MHAVLETLAHEVAAQIAQRYRMQVDAAFDFVCESWRSNSALLTLAESNDAKSLARTTVYKAAAKRAKAEAYYALRRYKRDENELVACIGVLRELSAQGIGKQDARIEDARTKIIAAHISTRERIEDMPTFFESVFAHTGVPDTVLDIGAGVQALAYPFDGVGSATASYVALDRDAAAIDAVNAWSGVVGGERLRGMVWNLDHGFASLAPQRQDRTFSIALALKFIPVVYRQQRELLEKLRDVPAPFLVATGATRAMAKRAEIARRERSVIERVGEQLGFEAVASFAMPSEIGIVFRTGNALP